MENADLNEYYEELGQTLGEALITPTKIYVKPVLAALDQAEIHGVSHITGGGFYENIPRCIPKGLCAKISKSAIQVPPIFTLLQKKGNIPERDMYNTYNMGVGMALIVSPETAEQAVAALASEGCQAYVIGEIVAGEDQVILE